MQSPELLARAQAATTDAERWAVIHDAWKLYCEQGASAFDWDYDSRDVLTAMTDYAAFVGRYR